MFNQKFFPKPDRKLTSKLPLTLKLTYKYTTVYSTGSSSLYICVLYNDDNDN